MIRVISYADSEQAARDEAKVSRPPHPVRRAPAKGAGWQSARNPNASNHVGGHERAISTLRWLSGHGSVDQMAADVSRGSPVTPAELPEDVSRSGRDPIQVMTDTTSDIWLTVTPPEAASDSEPEERSATSEQ